ncbi:MAG TPA: M20 family metallopeptidase [Bacillota bacterium]|nr:M20 family metallopeptidase [Bacillota bacterium]
MRTIKNNLVPEALEKHLIEIYKHLHKHPELSLEEHQTQNFIVEQLEKIGVPYKKMAGTGVCAEIKGDRAGKTVLLRCDMDALPISEQTDLPYASTIDNVMHACGHDAHVTLGLGVATILNENKHRLNGTLKIMFQPSEEVQPGGALPMIREGILENPTVDIALGFHTNPFLLPGKFETKPGYMLANSDTVRIKIKGKGGHAAAPDQAIDAIAMAGQFLTDIQKIVSRQVSPLDPAVITFGHIVGGTTSNVITDEVYLAGTVRTIKEETQTKIEQQMEQLLKSITTFWGGDYEYDFAKGHPASWNDEEIVNQVMESATKCFADDCFITLDNPYLSGDDFSRLASEVPAAFVYWGTGFSDRENYPWHHPKYTLNLDSIKYGVTLATQSIYDILT